MSQSNLDFLTDALVETGALEMGQPASPEEIAWATRIFNAMLDSLNAERLNIPYIARAQYQLTSNQGTYPISPTSPAPFNVERPRLIQNANIVRDGLSYHLDMQTSVQWAAIQERDNVAKIPTKLYYDAAFPGPATLNLNPIPSCFTATYLELFTWAILAKITDLAADFVAPPAYEEPLRCLLAVRLGPPEGMTLAQSTVDVALDAKARMRSLNAQILQGPFDTNQASGQAPAVGLPQQQ